MKNKMVKRYVTSSALILAMAFSAQAAQWHFPSQEQNEKEILPKKCPSGLHDYSSACSCYEGQQPVTGVGSAQTGSASSVSKKKNVPQDQRRKDQLKKERKERLKQTRASQKTRTMELTTMPVCLEEDAFPAFPDLDDSSEKSEKFIMVDLGPNGDFIPDFTVKRDKERTIEQLLDAYRKALQWERKLGFEFDAALSMAFGVFLTEENKAIFHTLYQRKLTEEKEVREALNELVQ